MTYEAFTSGWAEDFLFCKCKDIMTSFSEVMNDISQVSTVGAQFIPMGSYFFGANSATNTNQMVGTLGNNAASLFSGVTGAAGGLMSNPVVLIGGAVALLILLK